MNRRVAQIPGLGPVFAYEWLTASRRWHAYALRSVFVLTLLALLTTVWTSVVNDLNRSTISRMASLGQWFFITVAGSQLTIVLLAAPAATAGAICLDRARGTLTHMLMTDLSSAEIVLGKLAARLIPVLGMIGCTLPMMELITLLGGVDPDALVRAFVVILGVAVLGCSAALFFSLFVSRTHEALMCTYTVWILWLLCPYIIGALNGTFGASLARPPRIYDPFFLAFAPYWWPGSVDWSDILRFLLATCSIAAMLVAVSVWRIRSVLARDEVRRGPSRSHRPEFRKILTWFSAARFVAAPSLDDNPILWREWHRSRPSRWARIVSGIYVILALVFSAVAIVAPTNVVAPLVNGFQIAVGLLLLSVTAATSLAEERVRGSLDVLMATPLSSRQIVLGKWLGSFRKVPLLAILPAAVIVLATGIDFRYRGRWPQAIQMIAYVLSCGAAITSLGLAMATFCSRLSRAVASTVSLYVLAVVGWICFALPVGGPAEYGLTMGSPLVGGVFLTAGVNQPNAAGELSWPIRWTFTYGYVALVLLAVTLVDVDLHLGRVTDIRSQQGEGRLASWLRRMTRVYFAVAIFFSGIAFLVPRQLCFSVWVNAAQVTAGLLLVSVMAAASLETKRTDGAPDSLSGTRPRIGNTLLDAWVRSYRLVPWLAFLAALVGLIGAGSDPARRPLIFVMVAYIFSSGAAAASLGLLMATFLTRVRRAVTATVLVYFLFAAITYLGSMLPIIRGSERPNMVGPLVSMGLITQELCESEPVSSRIFNWAVLLTVADAVAAIALFGGSVVNLKRSIDRVAASPRPGDGNGLTQY
jgi:ABC-type transport system involved in multi-copper enzyme maturation permease subunit